MVIGNIECAMNRYERYKRPWDAEYQAKGRLWRRETTDLPTFDDGSWVLELGCGSGKTLLAIARHDVRLVGLDISSSALGLAYESLKGVGREAQLVRGECTALPFPDGRFDTVFAYHILDHLLEPDRKKAVDEIARVTAPGGTINFKGFSFKDLRAGKGTPVEEGTVEREKGLLYHYFQVQEVKDMFAVDGLKEIKVEETSWAMGGNDRLRRTVVHGSFKKA